MSYIYRHIRLDKNEPFYIGIGSIGSGKNYKRAKQKNGRNNLWCKIVNKTEYRIEILFDDLELSLAKEKEKEFILLYGRIDNNTGTLANLSAGGDGMFGVTDNVRKKISEKTKGINNPFYGKKHDSDSILKIKAGIKASNYIRPPHSDETKRKISDLAKIRPRNKNIIQPNAALNRSGVKHNSYKGPIMCINKKDEILYIFTTIKEASLFFGTSNTNFIRRVIVGERKTYKGFYFKYKIID